MEISRLVDLLVILIGFGIANVATVRRYVGAQMKYFNKGKLNVFCYSEWNTTLSLPLSLGPKSISPSPNDIPLFTS